MRHFPSRALYLVLCLFACHFLATSSAFGQTSDPQATPTPTPDATATPAIDPTTATDDQNPPLPPDPNATADQDRIDLLMDTDSPDLPDFAKGTIDTEDYLRMRNAHNRRLRGLMDPAFAPWRRNGAIYVTQQREKQIQDAAASGSGDPGFVGPVTPSAPAPAIPASLL